MIKTGLLLATFSVYIWASLGLQCNTGIQLESEIVNEYIWNETTCSESSMRCIRGEALMLGFGFIKVDVVLGKCIDEQECSSSCESLLSDNLSSLDGDIFTVSSCESICCTDSFCNNKTIAHIKQTKSTGKTATSTTPEPPPLPSRECYVGFEFIDGEEAIQNIAPLTCKGGKNSCLREEVVLTQGGSRSKFTVAMCANAINCSAACGEQAQEFLRDLELTSKNQIYHQIVQNNTACSKVCCEANNCNQEVIIKSTVKSKSPTSSITTTSDVTFAMSSTSAPSATSSASSDASDQTEAATPGAAGRVSTNELAIAFSIFYSILLLYFY